MTSAPKLASSMVAAAPGSRRVRSRTVTPSSGRTLAVPFQLAAGGINVAAARLADKTRHGTAHDLLKRAHALRVGSFERDPGPGFRAIRFILQFKLASNLTTRRASASVSLTPLSNAYSNVSFSHGRNGYRLQA